MKSIGLPPKASFCSSLRDLVNDSIKFHLRSDVPVGSYVSGGLDSSLMAILCAKNHPQNHETFHGRFCEYSGYDESDFAREAVDAASGNLNILDITNQDFLKTFKMLSIT